MYTGQCDGASCCLGHGCSEVSLGVDKPTRLKFPVSGIDVAAMVLKLRSLLACSSFLGEVSDVAD